MGELIVFYALASLVGLCSLMVITLRNPVSSAVFLVLDLFLLAGIYALQGAEFVAAIQILVYAGAILVLFMFVIMLLNLDPESLRSRGGRGAFDVLVLILAGGGVLTLAGVGAFSTSLSERVTSNPSQLDADNTHAVGMHLFTHYLWPFELASILILLAVVASIVVAKKKKKNPAAAPQALHEQLKGDKLGTR